MSEPLLLSIPEAAQVLGVGRDLVWELVHSGELPTVHLGRRRLVRAADLRQYVEQLPIDPGYHARAGDDHQLEALAVVGRGGRGAGRHPRSA